MTTGPYEATVKRSSAPVSKGPPPAFVIMVILGSLMVAGSLVLTLHTKTRLDSSRQVRGTIVGIRPATAPGGGSQTFYPVIRAEDDEGGTFDITGSVGSNPPPEIGGEVRLAYPPGRPQEAFVVGLLGIWFLPVVVGGLGAAVATVGLILLFTTRRPIAPKPAGPRNHAGAKRSR